MRDLYLILELPEWSLPDADEENQGTFEGGHFYTEKVC